MKIRNRLSKTLSCSTRRRGGYLIYAAIRGGMISMAMATKSSQSSSRRRGHRVRFPTIGRAIHFTRGGNIIC